MFGRVMDLDKKVRRLSVHGTTLATQLQVIGDQKRRASCGGGGGASTSAPTAAALHHANTQSNLDEASVVSEVEARSLSVPDAQGRQASGPRRQKQRWLQIGGTSRAKKKAEAPASVAAAALQAMQLKEHKKAENERKKAEAIKKHLAQRAQMYLYTEREKARDDSQWDED